MPSMTKEEFKRRWELNSEGDGITYSDIADCAIAWGISSSPRTRPIITIAALVLKAANTNDADEYLKWTRTSASGEPLSDSPDHASDPERDDPELEEQGDF